MLSVLRLASVFSNGFADMTVTSPEPAQGLPELVRVFCRVPSSPVLTSPQSALKESANASSRLVADSVSGGGEEVKSRGGGKGICCMPSLSSDVAEWGDMIRTVLPVLGLGERGKSVVH